MATLPPGRRPGYPLNRRPVWTGEKKRKYFSPTGIRTQNRVLPKKSLHPLRYPGLIFINNAYSPVFKNGQRIIYGVKGYDCFGHKTRWQTATTSCVRRYISWNNTQKVAWRGLGNYMCLFTPVSKDLQQPIWWKDRHIEVTSLSGSTRNYDINYTHSPPSEKYLSLPVTFGINRYMRRDFWFYLTALIQLHRSYSIECLGENEMRHGRRYCRHILML